MMTRKLQHSEGISVADVSLWSIQRDLIQECGLYDVYFVDRVGSLSALIKKQLITY